MRWFVIHLRNGKNVLVEGEEARDRAMARKSPAAVSWATPKLHRCCVCRKTAPWTDGFVGGSDCVDGWCWVGTPKNAHAGRFVEKFCSSACRRSRYPEYPRGDDAAAWDERITLQSWEPLREAQRWDSWSARREREQAFKQHRKFEMPKHENCGTGWCRWCGGELLDRKGKNAGKRSRVRTWHRWHQGDDRDCYHEYLLHTDRDVQWWHLAQRDGVGCFDCGKGEGRWVCGPVWWNEERETGTCWIRWSVKLEVDHETPLWMIPMLPTDKPEWRRALFSPDNLRLRCLPCHQKKSAREAAERARLSEKLR